MSRYVDADAFVRERDEAFTDFVLHGKIDKLKAYCKRYGSPMPRDKRVMACGVYKAVQYCTNIPEDVKNIAMQKCLKLGMSPFIDWEREVEE